MIRDVLLAGLGAAVVCTVSHAQEIKPKSEFRVKLLAPLSTETNKKDDKITAQITSPAEFDGAMMEGVVKESKSGAKLKGTSVLQFTFNSIHKENTVIPVDADVTSFLNSQGKANVDEEGRVIQKKNNIGKVAAVTGIGAVIGAVAGGAKGAAIGAGAGAAASLILIQMAVKAPNITFAPGSEFLLSVSPQRK